MRPCFWRTTCLLIVHLLALRSTSFGQAEVNLVPGKKLSSTANALPRIARPTPAQTKINRSLALLDRIALEHVRSCRGRSSVGDSMEYHRSIKVSSHGPVFFSFDSDEEFDCGGVHPYLYSFSLTFDLRTGKQVEWEKYLTRADAQGFVTNAYDTRFFIDAVTSVLLEKLYNAGYKKSEGCDADPNVDPAGQGQTRFLLSPMPDQKGLSLTTFDEAPNYNLCADSVILGKSAMDTLGIPADIQAALLAQP